MNFLMPIKKKSTIRDMADYLREKNERDYIFFLCGIYLGRRVGDLLTYRVRDLYDKDHISIKERKTGKTIQLAINPELQRAVQHYSRDKKSYDLLFSSQKCRTKPIQRAQAWRILHEAAQAVGYTYPVGCHTLRKTFAWHIYRNTNGDLALVQELLGHSDASVTRRYLGIDQGIRDAAVLRLRY